MKKDQKNTFLYNVKKYKYLYIMLLLPIIYFIIFRYIPLIGNVIAFRRYKLGGSMFGEEWVGLYYFKMFMTDPVFLNALKNTLLLSALGIIVNFPIPIIFALMVNEISNLKTKKLAQTISYLPSFISVVIIVGMLREILSPTSGIVNTIIQKLGGDAKFFMDDPDSFRSIFIFSGTWQNTGRNAIIYIAALASINPMLYEAATIDGANRWKQTLHITLPGIKPTIVILLIMRVGTILMLSFEKALLMYSPNNSQVSDIIGLVVYRMGLQGQNYSYAAAVGLFTGLIGMIMIIGTNIAAKKLTDEGLF